MNIALKITLILLLLVGICTKLEAQGREVTIYCKDGSSKSGELLSVRDSLVSILKSSIEKPEEIAAHPEIVEIALLKDIDKVWLGKYEAHGALAGALVGTAIGLGSDLVIASGSEPGENNLGGMTPLGALLGTLIGWGIAKDNSKDEEILQTVSAADIKNIGEYARFNNAKFSTQEPTYVREIIDNLLREAK